MAGNLKLDPDTWDLVVNRGMERVDNLALTSQLVKAKLQTVLGEWEPEPTLGMPWFDSIFTKAIDITLIQSLVVSEIKKVDHVQDVSSINLNVDKGTRVLHIDFVAISDWGEISNTLSVGA